MLSSRTQRICVVVPAYNAERTLAGVVSALPAGWFDDLVMVDDASRDGTVALAHRLGLFTVLHERNRGYGANQKTCYRVALARGADICVMVHGDGQYDPRELPGLVGPLLDGSADAVFGSRILGGRALAGGMPRWKYLGNRFLTVLANGVLGSRLSEHHSGLRAYSRRYLEEVAFESNSDGFVFDAEMIVRGVERGMRIHEVPIATRYFAEASQLGLAGSLWYGLGVMGLLAGRLPAARGRRARGPCHTHRERLATGFGPSARHDAASCRDCVGGS